MKKMSIIASMLIILASWNVVMPTYAQETMTDFENNVCEDETLAEESNNISLANDCRKGSTREEKIVYKNLSTEIVKSISTDELVDYVLNYPYLMDFKLFNDFQMGFRYLRNSSEVVNELFERQDAIESLLKKYAQMEVDYSRLTENVKYEEIQINIGEQFIQAFFAYNYETLTGKQKGRFIEIVNNKNEKKYKVLKDSHENMFYNCMMQKYGKIDKEIVEPEIVEGISVISSAVSMIQTAAVGFIRTSGTSERFYAIFYNGNYSKYGRTVSCLEYKSGEYSDTERKIADNEMAYMHPTWEKYASSSRKYNCHAYAWINRSTSCKYWLDDPELYAKSRYFYKINGSSYKIYDRIIIYGQDNSNIAITRPTHSAVVFCDGVGENTITISKCGTYGIYKVPLQILVDNYGTYYEVFRMK